MGFGGENSKRPRIDYESLQDYSAINQPYPGCQPSFPKYRERFTHNGYEVRVVLRPDLISVGCTDVTPRALRQMLKEYESRFPNGGEVILQP